jgi:hypothetical protein
MRRASFLTSAAATVAIAAALPAAASAASGNDIARGHVNNMNGGNWDFSAKSNADGSQPSGMIRFTNPNTQPNSVIDGQVTCLHVLGNRASLSGPLTRAQGPISPSPGLSFEFDATDSGKFSTAPDLFQGEFFVGPPTPPPFPCQFFSTFFEQPVLDGEIIIEDSTGK